LTDSDRNRSGRPVGDRINPGFRPRTTTKGLRPLETHARREAGRAAGKSPPPGGGESVWAGWAGQGDFRGISSPHCGSGIPRFPLTSVEAKSSSAGIPYLFPFKEGGLNGDVEAL